MLVSSLLAAVFATTALAAPKGAVAKNQTDAGSVITYPTANTNVSLNGTVFISWDWKETSSPSLTVLLDNANTTILHAGGHAPAVLGMGGWYALDTKPVLANATNATFGPLLGAGDNSIKPGAGFKYVLSWPNTGDDKATRPFNFLQSQPFTVVKGAPDQLPEGVKPYNAKPAAAGGAGRAAAGMALVVAGVAAACAF